MSTQLYLLDYNPNTNAIAEVASSIAQSQSLGYACSLTPWKESKIESKTVHSALNNVEIIS